MNDVHFGGSRGKQAKVSFYASCFNSQQQIYVQNNMIVEQERLNFLKNLYERKFYEKNTPKNTLEKVITFQKKLQDFKIRKSQIRQYNEHSHQFLLDQDTRQFRPSTTRSTTRTKKIAYAENLQNKIISVPTTSEMRLTIHPQQASQFSVLAQTIRDKNLYSKEGNRNQWKRTPRAVDQQSNDYRSKRSSLETVYLFNERRLSGSSRKANSSRVSKEANFGDFQNKSSNEKRISPSVSKKVFIGGQDLQKAAQEHYENFKQVTKNIYEYVEQQKKIYQQMKPPPVHRIMIEKKAIDKGTVKGKTVKPNSFLKGKANKTQPKHKEDEFNWNIEINPWNAGDIDYS